MPGDSISAHLALLNEMPLAQGQRFTVREQDKTIISGVITELLPSKKIGNMKELAAVEYD